MLWEKNYTKSLHAVLDKFWKQHLIKQQLNSILPPISQTIQVRLTRHAGHHWRSSHKLISKVLLWTPTYGHTSVGWPAKTYIHQYHSSVFLLHDRNSNIWRKMLYSVQYTSMDDYPCWQDVKSAECISYRGVRPLTHSEYDTKLHMIMRFQFWRFVWVLSTLSSLLPGPVWPKERVPVKVPFMCQIDLFNNYLYPIKQCAKKATSEETIQKCKCEDTMNPIL